MSLNDFLVYITNPFDYRSKRDATPSGIQSLVTQITLLQERIDSMSINLDALTAEVTRVQTVQASAVVLLKALTVELEKVSADLAIANDKLDDPIDTSGLDALAEQLKSSTDALAGAVADSADVKGSQTVILHADDPTQPTVAVTLPEVLPEVISVTDVVTVPNVDPTSPEPQVTVTVEAGTEEQVTSEDTVTDVIATDPGLTDVVVTAPSDVHEETIADSGVDVIEAVKEAYDVSGPEVEAVPEAVPAPVETAGVPGLDGTQSGVAVEGEPVAEVVAEPVVEAEVAPEAPVEAPAEPEAEVAAEVVAEPVVEAPVDPVVETPTE
jgi:hypothetical protein